MVGQIHGGGGAPTRTKRVFLISGTANAGYGVNYNWDVSGETGEANTMSTLTAVEDFCDARQVQVEVPSANNAAHFAGVVDKASDGVVGPNWILIHVPGSVCEVYTQSAVSNNDSTANRSNGALLNFGIAINSVGAADTHNGKFQYGGMAGEGAALILAEGAASVPDDTYLKMAKLLTGPPSGGYCTWSYTTTATGATIPIIGTVLLTSLGANAGVASCAIPDGKFIGHKLVLEMGATPVNTIKVSLNGCVAQSTGIIGVGTAPHAAVTAITMDASGDFAVMEWNGTTWTIHTSAQVT